ncbi:tyrosine-type recombinase/integrase [Flammeovirgaceae bacterium SG7u.111]|nr:tyrosine-type recombinase/integrase [Flammeovirgaceae bacterium SG7u.132]WPO36736.1 tyrosine-type recombinase/integrase [Flammeovirgaceae bacterium SG7u.111]
MTHTSISFRFRNSSSKKEHGIIYARVTINGVRSTDFTTGITTTKNKWINRYQNGLGLKLEKIKSELLEASATANHQVDLVKHTWKKGNIPTTLVEIGEQLLAQKGINPNISVGTYRANKAKLNNLILFDSITPIKDIDEDWGYSYMEWCMSKKGFSRNHSLKQVQFVKHILKYAKRKKIISMNGLEDFYFGFDPGKIVFLNTEEIKIIESAKFASRNLNTVLDTFIFQFHTGLSYEGLYKFQKDKVITKIQGKACILDYRQKSEVHYFIPLEKKAIEILAKYPQGLKVFCNAYYNRILKEIAMILSIDKRLTTHVARKTAGMRWLDMGYSIESVSLMLGHKDIKTTQCWYARVMPERVLRETEEIHLKKSYA